MRWVRPLLLVAGCWLLAGCGFVHFGRLPAPMGRDAGAAEAYSNLATEHNILKQELAIARKEGDALRAALERSAGGSGTSNTDELVARLNETSRELAALRASYSKLQSEKSAPPPSASIAAPLPAGNAADLEEKLATALRNFTQLQAENTRLRAEVDRMRAENLGLTEQLKSATAQSDRAQSALAQLNTELLAQKEARARAEQSNTALRTQLDTVIAHGASANAPRPQTSGGPAPLSALQRAKAPPAGSSPTAELRLETERVRSAATLSPAVNSTTPGTAAPRPGRVHIVEAGDTLEKLARQYYNTPEKWHAIYDANETLLGNGPLRAGMELRIPE